MQNGKHAIIHVADIHYRKDAPEGASSIIKAFLKDLKGQIDDRPGYQLSIAISGDIVQAGHDVGSYETVIAELDTQLAAIGIPKNARIVVPGNHDINRDLVANNLAAYQSIHTVHTKVESKFNDFMSKPNILCDKFENYELFVSEFANYGTFFSRLGWGHNISSDVGVYCLNSALCSFGGINEIDDEGELAIYTRGLVKWCEKKTTKTNILLLHHPLDHLNPWSKTELQHIISNHFTLCLTGHNHLPEVYHNWLPRGPLMCSAPPLFCGKEVLLAYSIVFIDNGEPSGILYREYSGGQFMHGSRLTKTEDGVIKLDSSYLHHLYGLEEKLRYALRSYKNQPEVFIEPKLSASKEFSDEPNVLESIIKTPENTVIVAPPQFGLTCLSLHMRIEAFKLRDFWIYINASHVKAKNVLRFIDEELHIYGKSESEIKSIMIDDWDASIDDHPNMARNIHSKYPNVPIILFSNSTAFLDPRSSLANMDRTFRVLHLQALTRNAMRQLVSGYNDKKHVETEDEVLSLMTSHMESINIHRTALNCWTLLRVLGSSYNEKLLNKTKLMKAILFVMFTDYDSFSYLNGKPEVDECTFVLGKYCKELVKSCTRSFNARGFNDELKRICTEDLITLDVDRMVNALIDNNILVRYGDTLEFKHRHWIFYFAAECMRRDADFKSYILSDRRYVSFPEIIDFYTGTDGERADAVEVLLCDLNRLIDRVDQNIGIHGSFNPLSTLVWNPSDKFIEETRQQIVERLGSSNLPPEIKDKRADDNYDSKAPYDQSINKFLNDYSVICLFRSITVASSALRNSTFIRPELKLEMARSIFRGWEEISKVIFWISPLLAQNGRAAHDGFSLVLAGDFSTDLKLRFKQVITANPTNVVRLLKDALSSNKIGMLLYGQLEDNLSELQKHLIAIFLAEVRPVGWYDHILNYLNRLHPSSFYLGDLLGVFDAQIKFGFLENNAEGQLKQLTGAVLVKRRYASKALTEAIPANMMLSDNNKLPIDKLLAWHDPSSPEEFGKQLHVKRR